ncbi:MAG TPA: MBL fold metallo-hydrolase [Flavobacteriales bacterium]|nr:MBL fold metallo-hydrolase [Flavobacteriales bacterium]HMW95937.1 MBL fold metallo-hydrolase [Flavobacteriales bacterium]HMZ47817.1 MBL fold metallo-hydrolase [Flavobacteriales bacterium]HNM68609.1 MBL fold metallo-hydrolase [Flavobacteriales bacterium]HNO05306.1 MBL fold metallo-hydrolase [Flavobacteriales bacterium]
MRITRFTFNPFDENTWVLDNGREALLVDPGCSDADEQRELEYWLATNRLTPIRLLLTHAHLDHVLGCAWMHRRFGLLPELHRADLPLLELAERQGLMYGIPCEPPPAPTKFLAPGDTITLGNERLEVLFVPGHAPGHIAFWHPEQRFVISGDVLFQRSIGRTDLPGGDMDTLIASIRTELFPLGDDVKVHCGHGPDTTIGEERRLNPFLR